MANDNHTTLVGNVTRDPELKFISSGQAVCEFGLAINSRKKEGDKWVDGDPQFFNVTCWGQMAENVAESLQKGNRAIVTGRLDFRQWEKDGEKRSTIKVVADGVGPDLRWATAEVVRNERREGGGGGTGGSPHSQPTFDPDEQPFVSEEHGDGWHEV
jgi:single-strand DNA-binding protein